MAEVHFPAVVIDHAGAQRQLNVGMLGPAFGGNESLGFGNIAGDPAGAPAPPLQDRLEHGPGTRHGKTQRSVCARTAVNQHGGDMVLQVLTDPRQVMQRLDAALFQMAGRPDAREHQQLRRPICATGQNDLAPGLHLQLLSAPAVSHADRPPALHQHLRRVGPRDDRQVTAARVRRQISLGGAAAFAVFLGDLGAPHTVLCGAVVVLSAWNALRLAG